VVSSIDEFATYLMTQSNVIAVIESGIESADTVHAWLIESLRTLFSANRATVHFGGYIWILQRGELPNPAVTSGS